MPELGSYDENAAPAVSYDPIPAADYLAQVEESDVKPTKQNTGEILSLTWVILDGPCQGRKVFDRINLRNANPQAQEIGQRQLAALRLATGVNSPRSSEELHNIPCQVKVKVRPAGPDKFGVHRDAQNEVKGYARLGDGQGSPVPAQQQPPAQPPRQAPPAQTYRAPSQQPPAMAGAGAGVAGSPGKPPWKR